MSKSFVIPTKKRNIYAARFIIFSIMPSNTSLKGISYVTGYQNDGTYDVAILWIRNADGSYNNKITLGAPFSSALYIYLPGKGSNTLENAFKMFSPMKYQKGY